MPLLPALPTANGTASRAGRAPWLALALLAASASAWAQCSRAIEAPVAPIGLGVTVSGNQVAGIYPTVVRELAGKHGCDVRFTPVPRARQEMLMENGHADLLLPASRSSKRDAWGDFVPLTQARPAVISLRGRRVFVADLGQVLARRELRVAVVRGFDFGEPYRAALAQLRPAGRLVEEVDASAVARVLQAGMADLTVMTPTILWGALQGDERLRPLLPELRIDALQDLDWSDSGVYLSRQALSPDDRRRLGALFMDAQQSGRIWALTQEAYGSLPLEGWMRPVPAPVSATKPSRRGPSSP